MFDRALPKLEGKTKYIRTQIQNIDLLYPDLTPESWLSEKVFDQTNHTLNYEKVKSELYERIISTFPKNLPDTKPGNAPPNQSEIYNLISNYLEFSLSNNPIETTPALTENHIKMLCLTNSPEEVLQALLDAASSVTNEDIMMFYCTLLDHDKKKNHYTEYMKILKEDYNRTTPIEEKTIKQLLKNVLPIINPYEKKSQHKLATQIAQARTAYISQNSTQTSKN